MEQAISFELYYNPFHPCICLLSQTLNTISAQASVEETMNESLEPQNPQNREANEIPDLNMDPAPLGSGEGQQLARKGRKELSDPERLMAYEMLLEKSMNGKLFRNSTKEVAAAFNVTMRVVQRLWKRGKESGSHDVSRNRAMNCGRKRVHIDREKIRNIPLRNRSTQRDLCCALGVSRRSVISLLKGGELRRHSNAIKPILTEPNKQQRIQHCLSMLEPTPTSAGQTFQDMMNVVHIDEKWFQMTKKTQTYYLLADEDDPVRRIKSSNFLPKIMFLAAIARPRYDCHGLCTFDGKIGIFPLVHEVMAARSSINRVAGTLELKVIDKIDREVIRKFMITMVLPAIRAKWPTDCLDEPIIIQQDNAKTHILPDDLEFCSAASSLGLDVKLLFQPPNSPDLNVLDLGFFRAIQSLQEKECASSMLQLVAAVDKCFHEFSHTKCNYIFLTLQSCMVEILKIMGSNAYKIPHMSKEYLESQGLLPVSLSCDHLIIETARANLLP